VGTSDRRGAGANADREDCSGADLLEIKIAWSAYENGKWAAKRILDGALTTQLPYDRKNLLLHPRPSKDGLEVRIIAVSKGQKNYMGAYSWGAGSVELSPCGVKPSAGESINLGYSKYSVPRIAPRGK